MKYLCPNYDYIYNEATYNPPIIATENIALDDMIIKNVHSSKNMHKMSFGELSALCSHLSKSCKQQYLFQEGELFQILANYYKKYALTPIDASVNKLKNLIDSDLTESFSQANIAANTKNDRGAKRILRWSKNVTQVINSILSQYQLQGDEFLQNMNVYICEICGYIHIDETLPAICPICRVSSLKIAKVT